MRRARPRAPALPKTVEELLQRMVGFDSVNAATSGNLEAERGLAEYLEFVTQAMGLATKRLAVRDGAGRARGFNLLVTYQAGRGKPWLLFDSHLDTVGTQGMTVAPFAGAVRDGRLYGRGACDTKASGAAALWALNEYAQSAATANNVALVYTVDEEYGMSGVRSLIGEQWEKMKFEPTAVVVGEPTLLRPVTAHNGAVRLRVSTRGQAAHSSRPALGRNAILMMAPVIEHLEREYVSKLKAAHPLTGPAAASITLIQGGSQINVIPERCSIDLDRRLVPGEKAAEATVAVGAVLEELKRKRPDIELGDMEAIGASPPLAPDGNAVFLPVVQSALESLGLPGDPQGVAYATHAGDWAQAGVPAIVLGPGDAAQAHTADEWVDLEQLKLGAKVYLALMRTAVGEVR